MPEPRPYIRQIVAFLHAAGAQTRIDSTGKHPRIVYNWQGTERFYVVPATPSDARGTLNAISNLRHALGLVAGEKRIGARRRAAPRQRVRASLGPPVVMAETPDWRDRLAAHPAARRP